jgi:hypothetical protein
MTTACAFMALTLTPVSTVQANNSTCMQNVGFLSFELLNACSLDNKMHALRYFLHQDKSDVVYTTETWL